MWPARAPGSAGAGQLGAVAAAAGHPGGAARGGVQTASSTSMPAMTISRYRATVNDDSPVASWARTCPAGAPQWMRHIGGGAALRGAQIDHEAGQVPLWPGPCHLSCARATAARARARSPLACASRLPDAAAAALGHSARVRPQCARDSPLSAHQL